MKKSRVQFTIEIKIYYNKMQMRWRKYLYAFVFCVILYEKINHLKFIILYCFMLVFFIVRILLRATCSYWLVNYFQTDYQTLLELEKKSGFYFQHFFPLFHLGIKISRVWFWMRFFFIKWVTIILKTKIYSSFINSTLTQLKSQFQTNN
jgi:hypothetical protein